MIMRSDRHGPFETLATQFVWMTSLGLEYVSGLSELSPSRPLRRDFPLTPKNSLGWAGWGSVLLCNLFPEQH